MNGYDQVTIIVNYKVCGISRTQLFLITFNFSSGTFNHIVLTFVVQM